MMAKNPKHLAVLNAAAEKAGWGTPLPPGVFRGICQNCGFGSYTAAVAEVSVSPKGELKIHRIVAATDPGYVVNPDQVEAQVEGSFVYGLSAVLFGEITIDKGRVVEGNFDTYQVMRLADMPKVETVIVPVRRVLGRRRRADHRGRRARGAERDLRRDRQAHPHPAAEAARPAGGMIARATLRGGGTRWAAAPPPPPPGASAVPAATARRRHPAVLQGPRRRTRSPPRSMRSAPARGRPR